MSVTTAAGDGGPDLDGCRSAEEYVIEALERSTAARSPKELAQAYGCGSGHIQNIVSELADDGKIERVERGLYTSADGESEQEMSSSEQPERSDTESDEAADGADSEQAEGAAEGDVPAIADDERADVVDVEASEEGGIGAGTALVGATLGLAAIVLVTGRSGSSSGSTEEVEEEADDGGDEADSAGPEVWS